MTRRPSREPRPDPAGGEPLPPFMGWDRPYGGRAANMTPAPEFQATSVQACGLFPFVTGGGAPTEGTPVGRHQLDGEVVCLDPLAWLRAGLITNPGMFLLGQPGAGKALDLGTPVPTPDGWTSIGAIRPGDTVLGPDGGPVPVMAVSPVMSGRECLQVTFSDGTRITADAAHQWVTALAAGPVPAAAPGTGTGIGSAPAAVRTTAQIRATLGAVHLIPAAQPLDRPEASLPVPPYLLGAWLATPGDQVPAVPPGGDAADWDDCRRPGGGAVLRAQLGLLGLPASGAVPPACLRASARQRADLLAGMLDTSGTVPGPGTAVWAAPSPRLASGCAELARTLGHAAMIRPRPGGGRDVIIAAAGPLFRHPAKHAALAVTAGKKPAACHRVIAVDPVPSRPVRCIQAASPSGLFLAGDGFTPTHNSTLVKRLAAGAAARGDSVLVLGDPRPDYAMLADHLGGQVIRVGRGMDKINPLDAGPLGRILPQLPPGEASRVRAEARARRLSLLMALCTLVRGQALDNSEEVILGTAIDLLDARLEGRVPVVPDVLKVIDEGPDRLRAAARADTRGRYRERTAGLTFSLELLLTGTLAGVFDAETTTPIDLNAPIVTVDISRASAAGDKLMTAAMLCTWSYGFGAADAAALLAEAGLPAPRSSMVVLDELWRALRGAPGLVEYADALTRLNRAKGMASIMITHSLADLDALPTEEDRSKARGFIERSAITALAALPPRELARVSEITPLTGPEADLVASWSAPDSWEPGARHPGRGKYLLKTGGRLGIPVELSLVEAERALYDTDQAIRAARPARGGNP